MYNYKLSCPRCKASSEDADLEVVDAKVELEGVKLTQDGYDISTGEIVGSDDEHAHCARCQTTFPLEECEDGHDPILLNKVGYDPIDDSPTSTIGFRRPTRDPASVLDYFDAIRFVDLGEFAVCEAEEMFSFPGLFFKKK
jgi:hypothetical protein